MERLEFINVKSSDVATSLGDALSVNESSRRRIRVQVMKDFWRKERKQQQRTPPRRENQSTTRLGHLG
jgi:hypothetical protein